VSYARQFFIDNKGQLYRQGEDSEHKLVVDKGYCMFMMKASLDSSGHKGLFATKSMIELRFWWPEME
jgi:hypothetical protein